MVEEIGKHFRKVLSSAGTALLSNASIVYQIFTLAYKGFDNKIFHELHYFKIILLNANLESIHSRTRKYFVTVLTFLMSTSPPTFDRLNFIRNQYSSDVLFRTRMLTMARMVATMKYKQRCCE